MNWFTQQARSAGDVLVCRRPRGGFNPEDIDYEVKVGGTVFGGSTAQGNVTNPITPNHSGSSIKTPGPKRIEVNPVGSLSTAYRFGILLNLII